MRTTGVVMLGVHIDTVPLACPSDSTAFQGFCLIASQGPSLVRCCATIWPVLVSCRGGMAMVSVGNSSRVEQRCSNHHQAHSAEVTIQPAVVD